MNEAARAAWARLSDLSKPIRGQPDLLAQTILHGLVVEKTDWEEVEVAHMEEIGLGLKTTAYAMWLRENGLRQCRNPRKWVRFVLAPQTASDIAEAAKGGALMRPVGKCAHCGICSSPKRYFQSKICTGAEGSHSSPRKAWVICM